jgi:hypothetical protein
MTTLNFAQIEKAKNANKRFVGSTSSLVHLVNRCILLFAGDYAQCRFNSLSKAYRDLKVRRANAMGSAPSDHVAARGAQTHALFGASVVSRWRLRHRPSSRTDGRSRHPDAYSGRVQCARSSL